MYADFFGFRELPFNNTPDPRFFYSTPDHEEALASLVYAVKERKGFVLLTGDVGTGKTLVTRMMLRHFGAQVAFAAINHAVQDAGDLTESICSEFEISVQPESSPTQLVRALHDFLLTQFAQNLPVVLVLDEAQNLSVEGFERLRMIGNLEADDAKLLQTVIVGQTELQRMFLSPQLRQLRQRVFRSYHLPAMNEETAAGYIRHRLSVVCDHGDDIFTADAIRAIYEHSRGLPRLINTLCDNALLSAYSADRRAIDRPFVASVIEQMMTMGHPPESAEAGSQVAHDSFLLEEPFGAATSLKGHTRDVSVQGETERAIRLASDLADRLDAIERRLHGEPAIRTLHEAPFAGAAYDDTHIRHELASFKRAVREYAQKLNQRFAVLEGRSQDAQRGDPDATSAYKAMKPPLEEARLAVLRGEAISRDLHRREEQLRQLSGTVRSVIRDLQSLLDRGHEMSAMFLGAQREAQIVHDRLVAQTDRGCRLADDLIQMVNRAVARDSGGHASSLLVKTASVPALSIGSPVGGTGQQLSEPPQVRSMLENAQTSLSELRNLARQASRRGSEPRANTGTQAVARLAGRVENLLEMIEPTCRTKGDGDTTADKVAGEPTIAE